MASKIFHMRLVVESTREADDAPSEMLGTTVAVDVVVRGWNEDDVRRIAAKVRSFLDTGPLDGMWAGIGRGEFVDGPVTLA